MVALWVEKTADSMDIRQVDLSVKKEVDERGVWWEKLSAALKATILAVELDFLWVGMLVD